MSNQKSQNQDPQVQVAYAAMAKPYGMEADETVNSHSGDKYLRPVVCARKPGHVDVYDVIETFGVKCPARSHAIKKLLCSGLRGKGDVSQDLREALDAVARSIELEKARHNG